MDSTKRNLWVHRLLAALGFAMLVVSLLFVHWYAMFEQHRTAVHAHLCAIGLCWFVWRMLRHCERYERMAFLTRYLFPSRT